MTTKNLRQNEQGEKLNKAVDKVLNQIFGQEAAQIIYDYLENNHSIQRHENAKKLDSFNCALKELLGTGALAIKKVLI